MRFKILLGVFAAGALVLAGTFFFGDASSYWSGMMSAPTTRTAKAPPARRPATTPKAPAAAAQAQAGTTLLRELPRQALFITAAHIDRLPVNDRAIDFAGAPVGS